MFKFSTELIDYVSDGDLYTTMKGIEHSTDIRAVVTVGHMMEHEKLANELPVKETSNLLISNIS